MGLERAPHSPSLRSLTAALGLDDGSVEEVMFHKSASPRGALNFHESPPGRPRSRTLSITSYDFVKQQARIDVSSSASRAAWSPASNNRSSKRSSKQVKEASVDTKCVSADLQDSDAASVIRPSSVFNEVSYDTWASTSQSTFFADEALSPPRPSASTIRTHSMYNISTGAARPKFHWPSRCWESTKKFVQITEHQRRGDKLEESNSSNDIKENPCFAAINAGLSGMPFADLILHCVSDEWETHAHSFIISSTCPALLQKIKVDDTLDLDIESAAQSSQVPSTTRTRGLRKSLYNLVKPQSWRGGCSSKAQMNAESQILSPCNSRPGSKLTSSSALSVNESFELATTTITTTTTSRLRRIQVTGCNGPDLRALLFYLYTGEFRMVSSHTSTEVDDSPLFRGHGKDKKSTFTLKRDDSSSWDPTRLRKSRSVQDVFWADKNSKQRRRSSTHTLLTSHSNHRSIKTKSKKKMGIQIAQHKATTAPPFSIQGAFHLGQILNLSNLGQAASKLFLQQLNPTNALRFYVSPFATAYPFIQSACLDYLVSNWAQVSTQKDTQTILGQLAAGWFPHANLALFKLLGNVS